MIEENHSKKPLLKIDSLSLSFIQYDSKLQMKELKMLKDISLEVFAGEIFALVGASGAGKSLIAHTLLGLLPDNCRSFGHLYYKEEPLTLDKITKLRGKEITLVPQTVTALDPLITAGKQVQQLIPKKIRRTEQEKLFRELQLPDSTSKLYPFELSGGMARRVLISMALASPASLVIADEPTPGLDARALEETLSLIKKLAEHGKGVIFITHDLNTAVKIANRIGILYGGQLVEITETKNFSSRGEYLCHPYSKALWRSLPENDFEALEGNQPLFDEEISGCLFAPRCPKKTSICLESSPQPQVEKLSMVRCFHA